MRRDDLKNYPSEAEAEGVLAQLVRGEVSRDDAEAWARPYILQDDEYDRYTLSEATRYALDVAFGAATESAPGVHLFLQCDFEDWLEEFQRFRVQKS